MSSRKSTLLAVASVAMLALAIAGCKKKDDDNKKAPAKKVDKDTTANKTKANPCAAKKDKPKKKMAQDVRPKPDEDYIIAEASHAKKKPNDPATVNFKSFKVVKAKFDPKKIVGGTAEIEIDLNSLVSGIAKRDGHLKSKDYFSVGEFGKATVTISDVKKAGDKKYSAKAEIDLHGIKSSQPVSFEVVSTTADSVRIKAEHTIKRADFKLGKSEGDSVADEVLVKLQLTVKNSG